jgi:hypothetical protein
VHCAAHNVSGREEPIQEIGKYYRISVQKIDGLEMSVTCLARFENVKEIDEANLKFGESLEEVLDFSHFDGPGSYKEALEAEGIGFSITCCRGVSQAMQEHGLCFADAMKRLYESDTLLEVSKGETFPSIVRCP